MPPPRHPADPSQAPAPPPTIAAPVERPAAPPRTAAAPPQTAAAPPRTAGAPPAAAALPGPRRPRLITLAAALWPGLCALLWPTRCAACHTLTEPPGLCPDCHPGLIPRDGPRCARCDLTLPAATPEHRCGDCLARPPRYDRAWGVFDYAGPAGDLIRAAKYRPEPAALDPLARALAAALPAPLRDDPPDLVVPLALHPRRVAARGHAPPLCLARPVARALDRPLARRRLTRRRHTPGQAGLDDAARRKNLRGAFTARPVPPDILLVDDVITTGATADAAARALHAAGATRVRVLCAARVERTR